MIEKEFAPYQESLELKELGFDEPCFGYYNSSWSNKNELLFPQYAGEFENWNDSQHLCSAPTFSQAFRWFREKYFIHHEIGRDYDTWDYELYDFKSGNKHIPTGLKAFETYEEAELACLKKLIQIIK